MRRGRNGTQTQAEHTSDGEQTDSNPPQSSLTLTPHFHFYAPISREAVCCTVTPSELTIGAHMSYPFLNPLPYITGPLSCPLIANKALGRKLGSNGAGGKQEFGVNAM